LKLSSLFNVNINVKTINIGQRTKPEKSAKLAKKIYVVEDATLVIDPAALKPSQRHALKQLLGSELLDQAGAILDETAQPTVNASLEALPKIEQTANQLIAIIPSKDIPLLYAALYLRTRYELGEPIEGLKAQIVQVYGTRGAHFANLCSAGYLERWFLPLFEELLRVSGNDVGVARTRFRKLYNNIVDDLPWTVFVPAAMTPAKLIDLITKKMQNNSGIGVRYLLLHALGPSNVKKVVRALPEIMKQAGVIVAHQEQEKARIFLRFELT
jgi:hypothetical protein